LSRVAADTPPIREHIESAIREFNGQPGRPESFNALHEFLEVQAYRLSYWRTASHEINYRRFFDVNTLAGLRVENPDVFAATHRLLGELIRDHRVNAVRIDHPDGLFDPAKYFDMLQALAAGAWNVDRANAGTRPDRPVYVVAEKILSGREQLPLRWAVHGTTGYNYLNELNGIFVDASQSRRLRRAYTKLTGHDESFDDVVYWSKQLIMTTAMASELNVLGQMLDRIGESNRRSRDFTLDSLRDAIREVVACFPVYRTYVNEEGWTQEDRSVVEQAINRARRRNPAMEASLFDFFREVVLTRDPEDQAERRPHDRREGYPPADANEARDRLRFAMKLQQYTGPVQAKGLEDTAFYRYNVLLSLNEVGGDPSRIGRSVKEFHEANARRLQDWPSEMLATATHDTKVGEDVRARINVLSEIPDEWGRESARWMRTNRSHRVLVDGDPAPDRNDEYRLYQALVGVWPAEPADVTEAPVELVIRLQEYMLKAAKEAKIHTSWVTPNEGYENAIRKFVDRVLTGRGAARFLPAFRPFQHRVARLGLLNSLAQLTIKIGSPGVPDFYQGTDLWDLSLVDPDNRRPVDFDVRRRALEDVEAALAGEAADRQARAAQYLASWHDGRVKLVVTAAGLRLRKAAPHLFLSGAYVPLDVETTVPGDVVAFARILDNEVALFVAPRLCARLVHDQHPVPLGGDCWKTSRVMLPPQIAERLYRDEVTGATIRPVVAGSQAWIFVGQLFETLPVAMMRAI
jgi:(1->4)-alpha-D-glucan 1-alpha-D-glucosylmutase